MKKILISILLLALALFHPGFIFAEQIENFTQNIVINQDGTINVVERIEYDFGNLEHHGIFRTIPFIKTNSQGKKFKLDFRDFKITDKNNNQYLFIKTVEGDHLKLKIGDSNKTITGLNTYLISYQVAGALTYYSDHDELYWNVTGNEWPVNINKTQAVIKLPQNISGENLKIVCYMGPVGSQEKDCNHKYENGLVNFSSLSPLGVGEGMTIVMGFPQKIVATLEPTAYIPFWETTVGEILAIILAMITILFVIFWYLALPIWVVIHWFRYGRDPKTGLGVAHVWFDVPKTKKLRALTPGETGTLVDEEADLRDIAATIVDLARRGYLKIVEKKKNDFYFHENENFHEDQNIQSFEKKLLRGIFSVSATVRIKELQLAKTVGEVKKLVYEAVVGEGFFAENPETIRARYVVLALVSFFTFNFPLALIAFIFGRAMPRKTLFGVQNANMALALRNFLTSQDRKLEFQARNQLFFEKMLPYAVAFGVEKIWAKRFADIDMKMPDWYQSYDHNNFTSLIWINSLSSSFNSLSHSATSTTSSSGFSSGFSGSGDSGGGGGGGGGGSW